MRKSILSAVTALGLLFGGLVSSAPAHADAQPMIAGTSTRFDGLQVGIPKTIDLHNTSISGFKYLQEYATTRNNVAKTCPKSDDYRIQWFHPDGRNAMLAPGQCFWPSQPVTYSIHIWRA